MDFVDAVDKISGVNHYCADVFCGSVWQDKRNQSMGGVFYASRRKLEAYRISGRCSDSAAAHGGHVRTGTLFLQVFLPDGSSVFPASCAAVLYTCQKQRELRERMFRVYKEMSGQSGAEQSGFNGDVRGMFSVSKVYGYLSERKRTCEDF